MNSPNIQNIPSGNNFRNCFEARDGFLWVSSDFSGQELNIMADRSNELVFIEALNNNEDLHSKSASLLFNKVITKNDKAERNAAKTITFGLCYGMSYLKLSNKLEISEESAKDLLSKYEKAFPVLMGWLSKAGKQVIKDKKAVTLDICKRIRWFPKLKEAEELRKLEKKDWKSILTIEGSAEREGKNHLVQGSGANITKEALVAVRNLIYKYNNKHNSEVAFLIGTVHDSIDCEAREDIAEEFAKDMESEMVRCGNKYVTKVKMGVDTTITKYWTK